MLRDMPELVGLTKGSTVLILDKNEPRGYHLTKVFDIDGTSIYVSGDNIRTVVTPETYRTYWELPTSGAY